ncbi:hypothetical protein, partial [Escherichia coli]|uniref:hypothetical protein n=1 Tax=Escherichia coli TaxID=562 RepID=UPI0039DFA7FC
FAMLIGFMVAAFMFARASGTAGAAFATNFAQSAVQRTLIRPATMPFRAAGSGAAWVGRTTAGNAARFSERKYSET